jgi:isovaleryl-CoA dehydrogenase
MAWDLFNPTDEHRMLRELVAEFTRNEVEPQAAEHDQKGVLNVPLFRKLGELGVLGVTIPAEDGGAGMDAVAAVVVHHELAKSDPGFTLAYLAHAMLFVNNFYWCSNAEQRERYLGKVLSGEWIAGMGMTEPGAGTDVVGMTTTAVRDGDSYVLNGTKTYITNGCEGYCFLVYAKIDGRVSSFVVDRDCPGFSTSQHIDKLGMRGSTMSELIFSDCRVPAANLLGAEGTGLTHMMRNLEIERLTLAAMSVGIAERCCEIMIRHAQERKTFGQPIINYGQIQRYVGDGYAMTEAAKALVYYVARDIGPDRRIRIGTDAAIVL